MLKILKYKQRKVYMFMNSVELTEPLIISEIE